MKSFLNNIFSGGDNSEHLTFKGVPLDGWLSTFIFKMRLKGFQLLEKEGRQALLKGDFASYKDCLLQVYTLNKRDLVSNIAIKIPSRTTWASVYNDYLFLKDLFTKKYGVPQEVKEKFEEEFLNESEKYKALFENRCTFESVYETSTGIIPLYICHDDEEAYVVIHYIDRINDKIVKKEALEDV